MKDVAAKPASRHLRSLAGDGGMGPLASTQARSLVLPLERALELARANASDRWAARRGYTAFSLQPVVARAYELAGRCRMSGEFARKFTWCMRDARAQHLVYESIEGAALALQDFLFANQNRLVKGRLLDGTAATRLELRCNSPERRHG